MAQYTIGVDVGGTKVLGAAVDPDAPGEPLAVEVVPTPRGAEHIVAVVASVVAALRRGAGAALGARGGGTRTAPAGPAAVGVGVAGLVGADGALRVAPNLEGVPVELLARLRPQLGVPVVVDNDANCAVLAELVAGAALGSEDVVYAALGTGVGGAVVSGGRVLRGAHGFAGEPGHMTVARQGWPCACGRLGCWEAYASGTGLARLGRAAAEREAAGGPPGGAPGGVLHLAGGRPDEVRGEHVTAAAAGGDPAALGVVEDFAAWVALGLSNLVSLLDPEVVVLGGTMVEVGELLLRPVRAAFAAASFAAPHRAGLRIEAATFGARAAATGAALLAGGREPMARRAQV